MLFTALYSKTSFSSQHITSHCTAPHLHVTSRPSVRPRTAPHRTARPAGRTSARLGEASERARVWFTVLLLPASQVVYTKSTL
jgi:hypothetical protein